MSGIEGPIVTDPDRIDPGLLGIWFWRGWFAENARYDQAVDTVITRQSGDTSNVIVAFGNRERGVLPIRARFTFTDGSTEDYNYPAEVWSTNSVRYIRRYNFVGKMLAKVEIDPENRIPDITRANNTWRAPDQTVPKPVVP